MFGGERRAGRCLGMVSSDKEVCDARRHRQGGEMAGRLHGGGEPYSCSWFPSYGDGPRRLLYQGAAGSSITSNGSHSKFSVLPDVSSVCHVRSACSLSSSSNGAGHAGGRYWPSRFELSGVEIEIGPSIGRSVFTLSRD